MTLKKTKSHKSFNGWTEYFNHQSKSTQTPMNFAVIRPETPNGQALVWLSGLTCTEDNFTVKAGAQRLATSLGLTIIIPDTSPRGLDLPRIRDNYDFGEGASFYLNANTLGYKDYFQMETYITDELQGIITNEFGNMDTIGIAGHSMGGHGALTLGLKYPNQYKKISAFSPICNPSAVKWGQNAFQGYLGADESIWKQNDAVELLRAGQKHPHSILVDQGLDDEFLSNSLHPESLKEVCTEMGQDLKLRMHENFDHSYFFIASFIEDHLKFHVEA